VHNAAVTREQYLALSKAWCCCLCWKCFHSVRSTLQYF